MKIQSRSHLVWKGREVKAVKRLFQAPHTNIDVCVFTHPSRPLNHPLETSTAIFYSQQKPTNGNRQRRSRRRASSTSTASTSYFPLNCVMKKIHLDGYTGEKAFAELGVLKQTPSSPFLLNLYFAGKLDSLLFLGLELCIGGDLHSLIYSETSSHIISTFRLFDMVVYLAEIAIALQHLHRNNVYHGDIKLANIFISCTGHIKLGDFGESKVLPPIPDGTTEKNPDVQNRDCFPSATRRTRTMTQAVSDYVPTNDFASSSTVQQENKVEATALESDCFESRQRGQRLRSSSDVFHEEFIKLKENTRIVTHSGTPPYCAPEVLFRKAHRFEPDWFSFGVVSCELLTGSAPFGSAEYEGPLAEQYMLEAICFQDISKLLDNIVFPCSRARTFVESLLVRDMRIRKGDEFSFDFSTTSEERYFIDIKNDSLFECINWNTLISLGYDPPYKPRMPTYLIPPETTKLVKSKSFYKNWNKLNRNRSENKVYEVNDALSSGTSATAKSNDSDNIDTYNIDISKLQNLNLES